jgi:chemotaxis protein MotB
MMQTYTTAILAISMVALAGCASWDKSPICNPTHQWVAWSDVRCNADNASKATDDNAARLAALEKERQRLADELAAAQRQNLALNNRLSDLEGQLTQGKGGLVKAEKDLLKALQPEISKGTVSVHQSGDALTINLASSLLFASGQDQMKAGGTDALKRVGGVLKDFP